MDNKKQKEFEPELFLVEGTRGNKTLGLYLTEEEIFEALSMYMEEKADEELDLYGDNSEYEPSTY